MILINKDCVASLNHYVSNNDDLTNGIDGTFKELMDNIVSAAVNSAFNAGLSETAMLEVRFATESACILLYHLFRIQKDSDDLTKNLS